MTATPDPHGQAALLLCESLLHVLVERCVLSKRDAICAVSTVADVRAGMELDARGQGAGRSAAALLRDIAASIEAIGAGAGERTVEG